MRAPLTKLSTRPPLERMLRIHAQVKDGRYPNAMKLARELEVTSRTIMRDLDFMRERLHLPLEYDERKYGYFYTDPVDKFPLLHLTEAEIFALAIAHKAVAQYRGTPYERPLQSAFRRLAGLVSGDTTYAMGDLESALSFRPFAPEDTDLETFELLTKALKEHRAVKFQYRKLGADRGQLRHVHPYHLACIDNLWYLFAFDLSRKAIRMFNLTRLNKLELTQEKFKSVKFDLEKHMKGGLSAFSGTEDYEVVLLFNRWGADLVRGRHWHGSQELQELPGGKLRMRLRLNSIYEVERFVLGFGEHVVVERPQRLRERLYKVSKALEEIYGSEAKSNAADDSHAKKSTEQLL